MIIDSFFVLDHPYLQEESTVISLLKRMDVDGVDLAVVSSMKPFVDLDFDGGNRAVHDAVKSHPDRFVGFVVPDVYRDIDSLDGTIEQYGMKGIRLHASYLFDPRREWEEKILEKAAEAHIPLYISVYPTVHDTLSRFAEYADRFADIVMVMSQIWSVDMWPLATILAEKFENIYLEVGPTSTRSIMEAARRLGSERLVLGSGAPVTRPLAIISHIKLLDLTEYEKSNILGDNIRNLLDIGLQKR